MSREKGKNINYCTDCSFDCDIRNRVKFCDECVLSAVCKSRGNLSCAEGMHLQCSGLTLIEGAEEELKALVTALEQENERLRARI